MRVTCFACVLSLSSVLYVLYLEVLCLLERLHCRCAASEVNISGLVVHAHGISSSSVWVNGEVCQRLLKISPRMFFLSLFWQVFEEPREFLLSEFHVDFCSEGFSPSHCFLFF